jgi:hypothetical protein
LRSTASRLAEPVNITLREHWLLLAFSGAGLILTPEYLADIEQRVWTKLVRNHRWADLPIPTKRARPLSQEMARNGTHTLQLTWIEPRAQAI